MTDESPDGFPVRVWDALNFSEANPGQLSTTGIRWCRDGLHFLVCTATFSAYIGLPERTVEGLWRGYGFHVARIHDSHERDELAEVADKGSWRLLVYPTGLPRGSRREDVEHLAKRFNWTQVNDSDSSGSYGGVGIGSPDFSSLPPHYPISSSEDCEDRSVSTEEGDARGRDKPLCRLVAFLPFANAARPAVMDRHPDAPQVVIARIIGHKWRNLPSAEKRRWKAQALERE
jgi:hypothetical protein